MLFTPECCPIPRIPQKPLSRHLFPKIDVVIIHSTEFIPPGEVSHGPLIEHQVSLFRWVEMQPGSHELVPHLEPFGKIFNFCFTFLLKPYGFGPVPTTLDYAHCDTETVLVVFVVPFPPLLWLKLIKIDVITLLYS